MMTFKVLQRPATLSWFLTPSRNLGFFFHWGVEGTESESSAQAAGPLPWQRAGSRRLPCHPRSSRSSPLFRFVSPRQHGPHRRFPHASGPSSQPRQLQASFHKPLQLPELPLATHMRNEPRVSFPPTSPKLLVRKSQKGARLLRGSSERIETQEAGA